MLAAAEWSLGYALELGSADFSMQIFWAKVQYFGIVSVAATMLVMVLQYTGHEKWLTRGNLALLGVVPAVTLILVWTNEWHHLVWTGFNQVSYPSFTMLELDHGIGFWLIIAYSYLCLLLGSILLLQALRHSLPIYRGQMRIMLIGSLVPWLANVVYAFDLSPFPYLDLTPFAFALTGVAATWGLFRFRFLDIVPVARDAVIEAMTDGVIVLDRQGRVIDANPMAQQMLNFSLPEVLGQSVDQALSAWPELVNSIHIVGEMCEEVLKESEAQGRWFDLRISCLRNRGDRWIGQLIALRDITARKRVEQDREQLIDELDAFAHTVAHDLKNPLTTVGGYVRLLKAQPSEVSDRASNYVDMIGLGIFKMQEIIDALLLLSGVRKRDSVQIRRLDMFAIVSDVLKRMDYMVQHYGAEIIQPDTLHPAMGYKPWVEAVWSNYLSNALKYGGESPRVELGSTAISNGTVRFWVRDNGPGISPEGQLRLFVPFSRLDEDAAAGHGLGLSIVQRVIERLGGDVSVESVVGEGSTFFFTLPAVDED
jgi:PAS domain S-box-containing protein